MAGTYRNRGVNPYVVFLDNNVIKNRLGRWYLGIRQLTPAEHDSYDDDHPPPAPAVFTGRLTSNYTLVTYTSGCYHSQPNDRRWSSSGCTVSTSTLSTADHDRRLVYYDVPRGGGLRINNHRHAVFEHFTHEAAMLARSWES